MHLSHHGVRNQQWGVRNGPPYPLSRISKKKTNFGGDSYILKNNRNELMGELKTFDYKIKDFDYVLISDVDTLPKYRRKGVATKLLNQAYSDAKKKGKGLYLLVKQNNDPAIKTYEKNGFQRLKPYRLEDGDYYIFVKGGKDIHQFDKMNFS